MSAPLPVCSSEPARTQREVEVGITTSRGAEGPLQPVFDVALGPTAGERAIPAWAPEAAGLPRSRGERRWGSRDRAGASALEAAELPRSRIEGVGGPLPPRARVGAAGDALRRTGRALRVGWILVGALACRPPADVMPGYVRLRVATWNVSMYRDGAGQLAADLATGRDPQAWAAAAVLRELRPDVLLLNEIDHDPAGDPVGLFVERYLAADVAVLGPDGLVGVLGAAGNGLTLGPPLRYPYRLSPPVNTGVPSGLDLDADGVVGTPEEAASDAWGFGRYPGQYGLAVLSTRPIGAPRTFQELPWSAMPDSLLYAAGDAGPLYPDEVAARVRLSSKTHADVPVEVGAGLHLLVSHPTPPVFDGPEDRNGRRNHDEVGFWTRYVGAGDTSWIVDDDGVSGGLGGQPWVVMGDLNNDPADGDGRHDAILGLIAAAGRAVDEAPRSAGAASSSARQPEANAAHLGPPALDTIELANRTPGNLRLDYVLPSNALVILNQGVFWPEVSDPRYGLVGDPPFPVSDHRLVWADLAVPCAGRCR